MNNRIGVDIGGTFTDFVMYDEKSANIIISKIPTTPKNPELGTIEVVSSSANKKQIEDVKYFLHGTTVGLNAILSREGIKVGLITTKGFRDVLELRRGDRDEMYNLFWTPKNILVPRYLRIGVEERVKANGEILTKLKTEDIREAIKFFKQEKVSSIAVCLLHSYANPKHENEILEIIKKENLDFQISLSHKISGEFREYERTTTTIIDAFVKGRMSNYLGNLEEGLKKLNCKGELLLTRSGSGSMTFAEARERAFETIMSGPVAGAEGAGSLTRTFNFGDLITADVGGTSFDTSIIQNGRPTIMFQGIVENLPIQTPWVDVRSIGAGGGSIAYVDKGGLLKSGPASAGADPGPACYSKGGIEPTTTDAAFYIGMLGEGTLASGLKLNKDKSKNALKKISDQLNNSPEEVAKGILKVSSSNMANAIREITIEQGIDPREMKLLAFGGAGPLMSTLIARELDITKIIIPPYSGNFSAWGLLGADLLQTVARTKIIRLKETNSLKIINSVLKELYENLLSRKNMPSNKEQIKEASLDLRYFGQEHTITVNFDQDLLTEGIINIDISQIEKMFYENYKKTFGIEMSGDIQLVAVRASIREIMPEFKLTHNLLIKDEHSTEGEIEAFSFAENKYLKFKTAKRQNLNKNFRGPIIVYEDTATSYIDSNCDCEIHSSGSILINIKGK